MDRKEMAKDLFLAGYNCAQSVAGAFYDVCGLPQETLLKMTAGFGGGFARTRGLCGAISGSAMIAGLCSAKVDGDINKNNGETYDLVRKLKSLFEEKNETINCGELLKNVKNLTSGGNPDERTKEYYKVRPCLKFVYDCVDILEKELNL